MAKLLAMPPNGVSSIRSNAWVPPGPEARAHFAGAHDTRDPYLGTATAMTRPSSSGRG